MGEAVGESNHMVIGSPMPCDVEPLQFMCVVCQKEPVGAIGFKCAACNAESERVAAEKKEKRRRLYVVTGEEPKSVSALIAQLGAMKLVGMTREQRKAQIPAPKREPGKREMARRLKQFDRDNRNSTAMREVQKRFDLACADAAGIKLTPSQRLRARL